MNKTKKNTASTIIQSNARRRSATRKTNKCPICLDILSDDQEILKPCNHIFHPKCIDQWTLRSLEQTGVAKCPLCRTQIELTDNIKKKRLIMKINHNFIEKQYEMSQKNLQKFSNKTLKKYKKFTHSQYAKQLIYEIASNYYNIILLAFTDINKISLEDLKEAIFFVGVRQQSFKKTNLYKIYTLYINNALENFSGRIIDNSSKQYIKNQLYLIISKIYKDHDTLSVSSPNTSSSRSSSRSPVRSPNTSSSRSSSRSPIRLSSRSSSRSPVRSPVRSSSRSPL